MSEFELVANRESPSVPEVGGDLDSHTKVLKALRECVMIGERRTKNLETSFVRVSELVDLGIAEIQGRNLVVATVAESTGDGAAGLVDGDYGDVVVSGTGTIMTIDSDAVTNAKLADMVQATVKGRAETAGTGNPTDLTMTELRAMLNLGSGDEVRGASFVGFGGAAQATVNKVPITMKDDADITQVIVLTTGGTGSCVVDIQKDVYTSFPPTGADSICSGSKPTITAGIKYSDSTLSGWNKAVSAGDVLQFELQSSSTFTGVFVFVILRPVGSLEASGVTDAHINALIAAALAAAGVTVVGSTYTVALQAGDFSDLRLHDLVSNPSGAVTVNFTLPAGAIIRASSTANAAFDTSGFFTGSTLNFVNLGAVLGKGGDGGDGASIGNTFGENGGSGQRGISGRGARPGRNGGHAILGPGSGVTLNITNAAGYIFGGGGGGGGGGGSLDFTDNKNGAAGGGGGGGAGGGQPGSGGTAVGADTTTAMQVSASDGVFGTSSRTGSAAAGGAKADSGNGLGGAGGDGGTWGADGNAGTSPTTFDRDYAAGTFGTAGKAISVNSGTVTFVSGNNSTHVKGAVS